METYEEYSVRCKTCNEPIAHLAPLYKTLLADGMTIEEALNELDIMNYCSRESMMNPTKVPFNMENRAVVEGFKTVDAVTDADAQEESTAQPVFTACLNTETRQAPVVNAGLTAPQILAGLRAAAVPGIQSGLRAPVVPGIQPIRTIPNAPGLTGRPGTVGGFQVGTPGMQTIGMFQAVQPAAIKSVPLAIAAGNPPGLTSPEFGLTPPKEVPILYDLVPGIVQGEGALGVGIPVNIPENVRVGFITPTAVGIPTINPDQTKPLPTIYVGGKDKYVHILNGRTYLAQ